jgi:hypothetical protein
VNLKKIAGTATVATALGAAALGLGAGSAQADPGWGPNIPWIPGPGDWVPEWNPGINWGPPGQVKKECVPPFWTCGTPPGHWINGPQGPPIPEGPWTPWTPWS